MAKKSIFEMLNQTSKQAITVTQDNMVTAMKMLDIKDLVPSKENFYSTEEIETLKATIEMFGVMQNILVTKIPDSSKYRILAGHRRCMAINRLVEEGKTQFRQVPCLIREQEEKIRARLQLLFANATMRQLSDWERVEQTRQLKEVLKEYKDLGNALPGRLRDYIAGALDVSPTTAGRLEKIDKNLVPELKGSLKNGDIALTTATELAGMSAADQKAVYEQTGGKVKLSDVNNKNNIPELQEKVEPVGKIERETMVLPKSHKTKAEIRIGYYTDGKYRYGIDCQTSTSGHSYMPSEYGETYSTVEEARAAALQEMADWNETLKKSLISGGYIAKPAKEKKQEYQESGSQLPADTEHRIYAVKSTMELLQKQIEKVAALKQIDESGGNTQGVANRAAQIEYLGEILGRAQNDLFDLVGQNIFEGCMNK
ncbi:Chromosome segregation protein Spo0J, contains ParB-like nuclease domain [Propionispira arboris]|uniref:Chromosome segregation protein Spo0J, contains ParB-like nuclease domain n=1 Tax=Propionispira arboris TaxID=84035 RepID=A0A1H7AD16_9FIRM|nr:ParB/RepB/Spo0J family partition protein [Propionispira arboris]SEJ59962.1 Chromosome segregation protein Spo0J, contains ParB-like nuclease domain [Propionispira arboris]